MAQPLMVQPEDLGLSPMHVACLNGDEEKVVETVRRHPQALELTTPDGVTPLMLASLMGHYNIVKYLVVVKSANILKETSNQKTAVDFAREDEFSNLTRKEFLEAGIGQENKRAAKNRQEILGLLSSFARRTIAQKLHRQGGDAGFQGIRLAPNGTKLEVYALIDTIETRVPLSEIKTLGMTIPERDGLPIRSAFDFAHDSEDAAIPGPVLFAASGWKTSHKRNPQVVDSELWTWVAHKLVAPHVGHVFPRGRDNGNMRAEPEHIGRVQASHVEVQLSTSFVFSLTEALVARRPWQDEADYVREQFQCLLGDRVRKKMTLGARRNMVIFINSWPCQSCKDYVRKLGELAGISFKIEGGHWIGAYPESPTAQMTPKGARWAPPDHELVDVEDRLAQAKASVAVNPNLMDKFLYRSEREATSSMSPGKTPRNSHITAILYVHSLTTRTRKPN